MADLLQWIQLSETILPDFNVTDDINFLTIGEDYIIDLRKKIFCHMLRSMADLDKQGITNSSIWTKTAS